MSSTTFPPLPQENIRALDQLRQRLSQLSTSLGALKVDLERNEPLPSWPSLQSSGQILAHNLNQLLSTFETHRDFFSAAHAYPLASFPGHTQEALLNQLLRKRLEPVADEWIQDNSQPTVTAAKQGQRPNGVESGSKVHASDTGLMVEEHRELWAFAGPASNSVVKRMIEDQAFEDEFTLAEREAGVENVITGLRRKLWDDDEEEGDGDEEMHDVLPASKEADGEAPEMEADGVDPSTPAMPLETVLRVMSTGRLPG